MECIFVRSIHSFLHPFYSFERTNECTCWVRSCFSRRISTYAKIFRANCRFLHISTYLEIYSLPRKEITLVTVRLVRPLSCWVGNKHILMRIYICICVSLRISLCMYVNVYVWMYDYVCT